MQKLFVVIILLITAISAQAGRKPNYEADNSIAVVLRPTEAPPDLRNDYHRQALKNYIKFFLHRRGWPVMFFETNDPEKMKAGEFYYRVFDLQLFLDSARIEEEHHNSPYYVPQLQNIDFIPYQEVQYEPGRLRPEPEMYNAVKRKSNQTSTWLFQSLVNMFLSTVPERGPIPFDTKDTIPVILMVDKSFRDDFPEQWGHKVELILDGASYFLSGSFNISLTPARLVSIQLDKEKRHHLEAVHRAIQEHVASAQDSLIVVLYGCSDIQEQLNGTMPDGLGFSDIGWKRITMSATCPDEKYYNDTWFAYDNGRILAHEIGHAYGAIHCYDVNSIMNPYLNWLGAGDFDDFNKEIVRQALEEKFDFSDPITHIEHIKAILDTSKTSLIDYMEIFSKYKQTIDDEWYIKHAQHACLLYRKYKSDSVPGNEEYLKKAALLGYYPACLEMLKRGGKN